MRMHLWAALAATAAFLGAGAMAADDDSLSRVPEKSEMVVFMDFEKLMELPFCKEMVRSDGNMGGVCDVFEGALAAKNMKLKDLFKKVTVFTLENGAAAAIIKTGVTEDSFEKLFCAGDKKAATIDNKLVPGKKVFIVRGEAHSEEAAQEGLASAMMYMAADTMIVTDKSEIKMFAEMCAKKGGGIASNKVFAGLRKNIGQDAAAWAVFTNISKSDGDSADPDDMADNLKNGFISLHFSGEKKEDVGIKGLFECKSAESASTMSMQIQAMIAFMTGQFFTSNPALGQKLKAAIAVEPKDKNLSLAVNLPKPLQDQLNSFDFQGMMMGGGLGVPDAAGLADPTGGASQPGAKKPATAADPKKPAKKP